ncbi:MAG: acyl-CoA dehydrogenase family protein [Oscillospiraceae bacterium]|nr:acyl-CoA dehydrogenase family protein [Oscillospiraceae bacterium]
MQYQFLTEDQRGLIEMIRDFGKKEVQPYQSEWDDKGIFPKEAVEHAFELGFHVLDVPEEYGGPGLDYLTTMMCVEEINRSCTAIAPTIIGASIAAKLVELGGTPEQKQYFYDRVLNGAYTGMSITEPGAGSDAASMRTMAVRDGDEYVLNGTKCFASNGGIAEMMVVFAVTDKGKRSHGISAFIVETDRPGYIVGKEENKLGFRCSNTVGITFDDCRIPASNLIGVENEGFRLTMQTLDRGRVKVGASAVGYAQAAIDYATEYAKTREQFGKRICDFEGIQFMLADMEAGTEAARQAVYYAARLIDAGLPSSRAAAIAKLIATDNAMKVTTDAVQIFGGYGLCKDYPVEMLFRDAKVLQIVEGTNQIQRMIIGRDMCR